MSEDLFRTLHEKEKQLNEQEVQLRMEVQQVVQMEEEYRYHFTQARQMFDELNNLFHDSSSQSFYVNAMEEFTSDSQLLMSQLEEGKNTIEMKHRNIQNQISDVYWDKQKVQASKKER